MWYGKLNLDDDWEEYDLRRTAFVLYWSITDHQSRLALVIYEAETYHQIYRGLTEHLLSKGGILYGCNVIAL